MRTLTVTTQLPAALNPKKAKTVDTTERDAKVDEQKVNPGHKGKAKAPAKKKKEKGVAHAPGHMRPSDYAKEHGLDPKKLRAALRASGARAGEKGWSLPEKAYRDAWAAAAKK